MRVSGKHHVVCDCTYTRVLDVSVDIFACTLPERVYQMFLVIRPH